MLALGATGNLPKGHVHVTQHGHAATRCLRCRIFERGLAACGGDYLAHALWDKALQFELAAGQPLRAAAAYSRVLTLPLRDLDRYWNRWGVVGDRLLVLCDLLPGFGVLACSMGC